MQTGWWENFFHGVALDFWRAVVSDDQTREEADFIQRQLRVSDGDSVLDVPCGNGRLAIRIARRGCKVTGVDLASEFITEAKLLSQDSDLGIDWQESDMRALPWRGEFDGAFCFGNSFGYLDDEANGDFLQAVSQTLKPGSSFILDAPAVAECILPNFQPQHAMEIAGIAVSIEQRYDHEQGRMFNDFTFTQNGITDQRPTSQRIYTYHELVELLQTAGLKVVAAFGSLDEEPFKLGSQRLLLVATKPVPD
ncbi:MAG: hypothetical protein QOD33_1029 [Pyrinomonadaceae bacterium]|jgi:SAM-dependent methyltransferase|nr:hypothetical protein [Pyrinomonadaceae bacterium]